VGVLGEVAGLPCSHKSNRPSSGAKAKQLFLLSTT
jgi:hypothetical protein